MLAVSAVSTRAAAFSSQSTFANTCSSCFELHSNPVAFPVKMSKLNVAACVHRSVTAARVMLSLARWRQGCVSHGS